ncbi:MAG: aminodeoxychorismate synthase component I [Gammaproteobacteria bacterium]|nr:aminodeoxychorismate synthase component I [Gammaproteobacteria bacterium]
MSVPRKQRLAYHEDSALLFESIRDLPWPVFLDSARPMVEQGRYDIISAAPFQTLITRGQTTEIRTASTRRLSTEDPFELLRGELAVSLLSPGLDLPFAGGAIGYFSYDLARRIEQLPAALKPLEDMPEMAIGLYDWALVVDHIERCSWLVSAGSDPATAARWASLLERLSRPPEHSVTQTFRLQSPIHSSLNRTDYQQRFNRIQRYIREGDCYQVNFAEYFQADVEGDAWEAYKRLRRINPAPFSAYLEFPFGRVLSSSPERFLKVNQRHVQTCPIKGTAPRHVLPEQDQAAASQLNESVKDRAENLMIVDLLRNDLGKVCEIGSVEVTSLFEVQSFARVHHLVSVVEAVLAGGQDAMSLLRACFPGGSITGAPKLRAMQIIEELETARRGIYCGSIGYIGFAGAMDSNIAIRTLVNQSNRISFWAGGGIVADSSAAAEYQEILDKSAAIFEMLDSCSRKRSLRDPGVPGY